MPAKTEIYTWSVSELADGQIRSRARGSASDSKTARLHAFNAANKLPDKKLLVQVRCETIATWILGVDNTWTSDPDVEVV